MLAQPIAHPGWLTARRMNRVRTDVAGLVFALPFLVFYVLFTVWPIISGLLMSFFKVSLLGGSWSFMGLDNYAEAIGSPDFRSSLWHSVQFTIK